MPVFEASVSSWKAPTTTWLPERATDMPNWSETLGEGLRRTKRRLPEAVSKTLTAPESWAPRSSKGAPARV
jgi:hypothetical protein